MFFSHLIKTRFCGQGNPICKFVLLSTSYPIQACLAFESDTFNEAGECLPFFSPGLNLVKMVKNLVLELHSFLVCFSPFFVTIGCCWTAATSASKISLQYFLCSFDNRFHVGAGTIVRHKQVMSVIFWRKISWDGVLRGNQQNHGGAIN